jgi:hypothetical protein
MNSREKGKRGERAWRDELRAQGFDARRGQQFSGSPDSPDVICDQLSWIHFEVKCVERLNIEDAMAQARRDSQTRSAECGTRKEDFGETPKPTGGTPVPPKIPVVAHKRNFCGWLVTMDAETFFKFLKGDFSADTQRNFLAMAAKEAKEKNNLGVSREAHDTTGETPVLPKNTENKNSEQNKTHEDQK